MELLVNDIVGVGKVRLQTSTNVLSAAHLVLIGEDDLLHVVGLIVLTLKFELFLCLSLRLNYLVLGIL